jgi:Rad3-related DNA helicase
VVLLDRRAIMREYGARMLASLPDARLHRVPRDDVAATVAAFCNA